MDFQVTKQHRRYVEFADAVRRHRYIGACYGAPGLGKTLSARTYAAADDYDEWEHDRYSRGTVLPASLVASRTLFYTPLVHINGRRLDLEVDLFSRSLSPDINRALDPQCHPDIDEDTNIPYLTELVIIDEADWLKTKALKQLRDFFYRNSTRERILQLAASGDLEVPVSKTCFPIVDAAQALALLKSKHPGGKLALIS